MGGRNWYKVRVRECLESPKQDGKGSWIRGKYALKTKTYFAASPRSAAAKYKGEGDILHVDKVSFEELYGIGEFFTLGDKLLAEIREEEGKRNIRRSK